MSNIVPGMAEAIEARRVQMDLSPKAFAIAAGVTAQGLAPLRRGELKNYQHKLKVGAARALGWTDDSIDRLMRGEEPVELDPTITPATLEARLDQINERLAEILRRLDERESGQ